jgi:hypothetical protein
VKKIAPFAKAPAPSQAAKIALKPGSNRSRADNEQPYYEPESMPRPRLESLVLLSPVPQSECVIWNGQEESASGSLSGSSSAPSVTRPMGGIRRVASTVRIQIGIDFGTSCTKIMYQRLGVAERIIRPIQLDHRLDDCPSFAVPSVAAFDQRGELLLGDVAARRLDGIWGRGLTRFKMLTAGRHAAQFLDRVLEARFRDYVKLALGDEYAINADNLSATYLAFVMRRTRRVLEGELGTRDLDLRFNTCVPVDQRQNDAVYSAFRKVAAVAQALEETGHDSDSCKTWLLRSVELWPHIAYSEHDARTRVFLVPEAVAATAGYLTSLARDSGLHALVDIGSGTTDVSIFQVNLAKGSGLTTLWYAARSIPIGMGRIEELVAATLRTSSSAHAPSSVEVHRALAGDPAYRAACESLVHTELTRMWHGTTKAWAEAYSKEPQQHRWMGGSVRVFLAGGGALVPATTTVFSRSWQPGWGPYPTRPLPEPDGGTSRAGHPYARLCVAFGLATPIGEIGEYSMPSEVKRVQRFPTFRSSGRSDDQGGVDQLLPKYGWC